LKWELVKPPKKIINKMSLPKGSTVLEIVRLRFHKGEPVALDYTYIPKNLSRYFKDKRKLFESKYIYDIYKTIPQVFLENSKISIKSILCDKSQAKILGIAVGDPLLFWERTTFSKDKEVIEISSFFARGDKCTYYIEFNK